jgi:hypothetical protein
VIKFEDIAFGDLLYLEAGEYNAEGWHAVTVCYGDVREVALLEDKGPTHGTSLYPSDAHMIYKHIRVSGIPFALEALEAVEHSIQLAEVSNEGPDPLKEWLDASNDAIAKVRIALRAVRGKPA